MFRISEVAIRTKMLGTCYTTAYKQQRKSSVKAETLLVIQSVG